MIAWCFGVGAVGADVVGGLWHMKVGFVANQDVTWCDLAIVAFYMVCIGFIIYSIVCTTLHFYRVQDDRLSVCGACFRLAQYMSPMLLMNVLAKGSLVVWGGLSGTVT